MCVCELRAGAGQQGGQQETRWTEVDVLMHGDAIVYDASACRADAHKGPCRVCFVEQQTIPFYIE